MSTIGKTIVREVKGYDYITFYFADGTTTTIRAVNQGTFKDPSITAEMSPTRDFLSEADYFNWLQEGH